MIGAGVIGLELGSVWRRRWVLKLLYLKRWMHSYQWLIKPWRKTTKTLTKQGLDIRVGAKVAAQKLMVLKSLLNILKAAKKNSNV